MPAWQTVEGKGSQNERGEDPARFEEERAARTLLFSSFLPSDARKNPDWSNLLLAEF